MEDVVALRVTFDTNSLDPVLRPQLFPGNPRNPEFQKINAALLNRSIEGVFSETIITIEGIKRADRALVFRGTRLRHNTGEASVTAEGNAAISLELVVEQPALSPLNPAFAVRVGTAVKLGLRMLRAPRIGALFIEDPDKTLYVYDADTNALAQRQERFHDVLRAIESKGLGFSRLRRMADEFAERAGVVEPWYKSIGRANDIHKKRAVERAFAEWSDADSIAAHIGYGMELFCTEDQGHSGNDPTIFDAVNRSWLEQTYGTRFVTLSELAAMV